MTRKPGRITNVHGMGKLDLSPIAESLLRYVGAYWTPGQGDGMTWLAHRDGPRIFLEQKFGGSVLEITGACPKTAQGYDSRTWLRSTGEVPARLTVHLGRGDDQIGKAVLVNFLRPYLKQWHRLRVQVERVDARQAGLPDPQHALTPTKSGQVALFAE